MGNPIPTFRGKILLFLELKCPRMAVLDVLILADEGTTLLRNVRIRLPIYAESYTAAKASKLTFDLYLLVLLLLKEASEHTV